MFFIEGWWRLQSAERALCSFQNGYFADVHKNP